MISDWSLVKNLAKVTTLWISYAMIMYTRLYLVRYLPGDIYINQSSSYCAELTGVLLIQIFMKTMEKKNLIKMFFILLGIGTYILLATTIYQSVEEKTIYIPVSQFFISMGTTGSINTLYLAHNDLFPAVFRSTTLGICNILARGLAMFAPLIAEIPEPYPEWFLFTVSTIAICTSFFLEKKSDKFY